ncbi:MAG: hypothetical protein AAF661_09255 [Pseudomonadota bacterium]
MTEWTYRAQAWVWRAVAQLVPTCFLQWELQRRPGVEAIRRGIGERAEVAADGPCTVTINRD